MSAEAALILAAASAETLALVLKEAQRHNLEVPLLLGCGPGVGKD